MLNTIEKSIKNYVTDATIIVDDSPAVDINLYEIFIKNNVFIYHLESFLQCTVYRGIARSSTLIEAVIITYMHKYLMMISHNAHAYNSSCV